MLLISQKRTAIFIFCFVSFFYKTKPFKNHFLNLFFDTEKGTNETKETNQYEIPPMLKEYMKLLSYKYKEQYEDSKMSMNDDQSLSLKKKLFDEKDEDKLKHNLIYQHRSSTNIIPFFSVLSILSYFILLYIYHNSNELVYRCVGQFGNFICCYFHLCFYFFYSEGNRIKM